MLTKVHYLSLSVGVQSTPHVIRAKCINTSRMEKITEWGVMVDGPIENTKSHGSASMFRADTVCFSPVQLK